MGTANFGMIAGCVQLEEEEILDADRPHLDRAIFRSEGRDPRSLGEITDEDPAPEVLGGRHIEPGSGPTLVPELLLDVMHDVVRHDRHPHLDVDRLRA